MRVVSPADPQPSPFVVIEMWGCAETRFGGPNDEAIRGHPLHGKGLAGYRAHEVVNSGWIEEAIKVNSVHPHHSDAAFRQLHHYALLFHDEMLEALARGIESRLVTGTMGTILGDLASSLTPGGFYSSMAPPVRRRCCRKVRDGSAARWAR